MISTHNPGRVAGVWYLLLILIGPLRLIYIPNKLFVPGNASATANNIATHEWLFRFGMISELVGAVILIYLTLAFYRLFAEVNRNLAVQVVIFGGLMPALLYFVNVVTDAGALMIVRGADFLSVFDKPQQNALVVLLLRLHSHQFTATLVLAGLWLFPLGILVYRSGFLPRFLGVWLLIAGVAWLIMSLTGYLAPQYSDKEFVAFQPVVIGELAFMLWLVVKGAKPASVHSPASLSDVRVVV
jgi:hypothetical protein